MTNLNLSHFLVLHTGSKDSPVDGGHFRYNNPSNVYPTLPVILVDSNISCLLGKSDKLWLIVIEWLVPNHGPPRFLLN